MKLENTIANQIAAQDPEAFELLQKIINRPSLFVGSSRFDYVDHLLGGYCLGRGLNMDFLPNQELQYWLLHTQSATLHGSISGRQLFYRCFGYKDLAFQNYKAFLHADLPQILDAQMRQQFSGIDYELCVHEDNNGLVRYDWEDDIPSDHYEKLAQSVLINISNMINKSGFTYDTLRIYIRREALFCQVRFLFHGGEGWMDDSDIIAKPDNHGLLIALHANAINARADDLRNCGCDVVDVQDYDEEFLPPGDTFCDEITFLSEYLRWRSDVISSHGSN